MPDLLNMDLKILMEMCKRKNQVLMTREGVIYHPEEVLKELENEKQQAKCIINLHA